MSKPKPTSAQLHVRLHVQPFYPIKINGVGGRRMWRVGIEKQSAAALGIEATSDYIYGTGSVEVERVDTQKEAIDAGVARQRRYWSGPLKASSSLYIHDRKNKILKGNRGERTYPRSADSNPPQGAVRAKGRK